MIKSMTAFGRAKHEGEDKDITIEIKSVNSRFFDCNVKLPRAYIFLEERIKEHIKANAVARAKVDVFVTVDNHTSGVGNVGIDAAYAESYIAALRELREETGATCRELVSLGEYYGSPAIMGERIFMYLATGLEFGDMDLDDDEFLEVVKIPAKELEEMIYSGKVTDGKTQAAVLKALHLLRERGMKI